MIEFSTLLKYYKRQDIQEAIVEAAAGKEVAVKFGDRGFGKRPDTLKYPNDVLEFAKQRATSFHCSEELWTNPLLLKPGLRPSELDSIRKGWDLVLDIDCPDWEVSKVITFLLIKSLKEHRIKSVSLKFSGNKGFHIGVPFEAFPKKIGQKKVEEMFPSGPKEIAMYLLDFISRNYAKVKDNDVMLGDFRFSIEKLRGIAKEEITRKVCPECKRQISVKGKSSFEFLCGKCGERVEAKEDTGMMTCPKCGYIMDMTHGSDEGCACGYRGVAEQVFNPFSIIEVDTILISSRHLYRMPYSLHEKSGMASLPILPESVLDFEKEMALPQNIKITEKFLDRESASPSEASYLVLKAIDFAAEKRIGEERENGRKRAQKREFDKPQSAMPEEFFPPCIINILKGMDDGKKRCMFILVNFLSSLGWDNDAIEKKLKEWNKKNREELREVTILGQVSYQKRRAGSILPPNCDNKMYYKDIRICAPDSLCQKIRNPVNYSIIKARIFQAQKPKKPAKS